MKPLMQTLAASGIMSASLLLLIKLPWFAISYSHQLLDAGRLIALIATGGVIYALSSLALGNREMAAMTAMVRKKIR